MVLASARERDLARVATEVGATFGEDGCERVAVERHQDGRVLRARRVQLRRLLGREQQVAKLGHAGYRSSAARSARPGQLSIGVVERTTCMPAAA